MKPKTAAVIGIGTEIMKGAIDDTNATFLSQWLFNLGLEVRLRVNVPDAREDIAAALRAAEGCGLVILTGGLGPTDDDLTREALAAYLGRELVFDEQAWTVMRAFFEKRGRETPESNRRQAFVMTGAEVLSNPNGTAPGQFCEAGGRHFALLPGPPAENQPMAHGPLLEKLRERGFSSGAPVLRVIRTYGVGESALADLLPGAAFRSEVGWYFSQEGWVEMHFTARDDGSGRGAAVVDADCEKARTALEKSGVFFTGPIDLSTLLLEELAGRGLTIAFAESITGGAMAAELVKNPGASNALRGGVVAYSNEIKEKLLGVSAETLRRRGAVSAETVREMAAGLRERTGADVCVAVSGIAGPDGGSRAKPIGLVHFGFLIGDRDFQLRALLPGNRLRVIRRAVAFAFVETLKALRAGDRGTTDNTDKRKREGRTTDGTRINADDVRKALEK
ncbi:MAG: CinA family nicotinamide mononucleotide deamidase-related protein [Spirochaetales bacterium]|nr:CinA family nicotinamide mononucleotide deamidase-related protein [Spirochaetales bacterium]